MFGDMFNEDLSAFGPAVGGTASISLPPPQRSQYGLAGIDNQGATCYLNSLLQTLLLTPEFRDKLFSLTEKELGRLENKDVPNAKVRVIPIQLQRVFSQLLLSNQQSVSTVDLTNSFGWTNQEGFQQHDVQELNRILFSAIEESLVGTPGQNIIKELYHGLIVNQIKCSKCKRISEREEDFLDLTLAIAGVPGLEAALKKGYCDVEVMDGRNQYRCEKCATYTDAIKGAKLRKLPPILTLSLLRFSYDFVKMTRYKENGRFAFPLELNMNPYSEKDMSDTGANVYELFSVVVHRGGAYGGHYFAYIRDIDDIGHWETPDDSSPAKKVNPQDTGLDVIECQSPVDLVENILSQAAHNAMSVDRLCAEISKATGVSWNKRFKKTHGPINKFLKACDSFDYNPDSNWVSLSDSAKESSVDPVPNQEKKDGDTTEAVDETSTTTTADHMDGSGEKCPPSADSGHRWFSFNDSSVCPINTKDIEKQFSGKESAYMLFYRLKTLARPEEARGQVTYKIPQELIAEVEKLNLEFEKQRQEYESKVNEISIQIYHQEDFMFDGLLRPKPSDWEEPTHFTLLMDKRNTLEQLRESIFETIKRHPQYNMYDFSLHRMKACCGGYHLYEEYTDQSKSLAELGFAKDTSLFLWNGAVIDNEFVPVGEESEPLLLTVRDLNAVTKLAQIVVAKNKTLAELYSAVDQAMGMEKGELKLARFGGRDENGSTKLMELACSIDVTLLEAQLNTGDVLIATGANDGFVTDSPETQSSTSAGSSVDKEPEWSITLQNRLVEDIGQTTCKTAVAKSRPSVTVKDLKVQALNQLQIHGMVMETVRLREDHKTMGLQPPLREGLSLADAGLYDGATLVIESGRPPQDSEMTVSVNKLVSGKLVSKREFLVDRQLTVQAMLQAACRLMECEGTQWYLSKTDMYGDPAESLDNEAATLMDLLINDGDTLVLQKGNIIKKDEVGLNIWLSCDTIIRSSNADQGSGDIAQRQEEEDKVMLELATKLSLGGHVPSKDLNPLNKCLFADLKPLFDNCLVIPKSMGTEELKQALLATEQFQTLRIPTANFMRLRVVENSRLRTVLRNNTQTLRHHNSKEALNLAVQILPYEESVGVHELLLYVAQKIGGTRVYLPAKEFIWSTSGGQGPADLKRAIASRYNLPLHDVLLAKYNAENFSWLVLKEMLQKPAKQRGKKGKAGVKTNLRQAPYYVQDGDIIGVKLLSEDKGYLDPDDFSTQEDIEKRQVLQQIAEEKKRLREDRKKMQEGGGFPCSRRPEVPLTIKVDKFS